MSHVASTVTLQNRFQVWNEVAEIKRVGEETHFPDLPLLSNTFPRYSSSVIFAPTDKLTIPVKPVISLSRTSRRKQFQQEVFDHLHCEMLVAPLDTLVQDCQEYIDHLEYPRTFG